jgi:hypothetical protein
LFLKKINVIIIIEKIKKRGYLMNSFYKDGKKYFQLPVDFFEIIVFLIVIWVFLPAIKISIFVKIILTLFTILDGTGIIPAMIFVFQREE